MDKEVSRILELLDTHLELQLFGPNDKIIYHVDNRPYLQFLENQRRIAEAINLLAAYLGVTADTSMENLEEGLDRSHMKDTTCTQRHAEMSNAPLKKLMSLNHQNEQALRALVKFVDEER